MTQRMGALDFASLSDAQRRIAEQIQSGPRKGLAGPFWPWLRSPELADHAQQLGEFLRFKTSLPQRLVELAVLYTARSWIAQFEWYAHAPIALREGVSPDIVDAIAKGVRPNFVERDEAAVYDVCAELYTTRRVGDTTYETARAVLGDRGIVELIGLLGYYALVSMTLNVFEVRVPPGTTPPFAEP